MDEKNKKIETGLVTKQNAQEKTKAIYSKFEKLPGKSRFLNNNNLGAITDTIIIEIQGIFFGGGGFSDDPLYLTHEKWQRFLTDDTFYKKNFNLMTLSYGRLANCISLVNENQVMLAPEYPVRSDQDNLYIGTCIRLYSLYSHLLFMAGEYDIGKKSHQKLRQLTEMRESQGDNSRAIDSGDRLKIWANTVALYYLAYHFKRESDREVKAHIKDIAMAELCSLLDSRYDQIPNFKQQTCIYIINFACEILTNLSCKEYLTKYTPDAKSCHFFHLQRAHPNSGETENISKIVMDYLKNNDSIATEVKTATNPTCIIL